jgi:hypothetical protein
MNPHCDRCTQLLLDYIAVGNHLVDVQANTQRLPANQPTSGLERLALAKTAATAARKHLVAYQRLLPCHCGDKLRTRRAATPTARKRKNLSA